MDRAPKELRRTAPPSSAREGIHLLRRSRAFISLGFPFAPFHPRTSLTFRARSLREKADAASVRIVSRIDVSRVWPKIFMPTDTTKTLALFTLYLWGKVRACRGSSMRVIMGYLLPPGKVG